MKSIILAAGFATRLYPLTKNKAKPLLEIRGKPIIDYTIEKIREITSEEIIIITNNLFYHDFCLWKMKTDFKNVSIINDGVSDSSSRLGAIGDLLFVIDKLNIDEDLFAISGDNMFDYSLKDSFNLFREKKQNLSVFYDIKNLEEAKRFGVAEINNSGIISNFEEKPNNPQTTLCSTSTHFFLKEIIPLMREFCKEKHSDQPGLFLKFLFPKIQIYAHIVKGEWIDVGTKESLSEAIIKFGN